MSVLQRIEAFLALKRIAVAGVSRKENMFGRQLFEELVKRGYDVVPVNPAVDEVSGKKCYPRVQDISPPVDGVILVLPKAISEDVAGDCVEAGIRHVWVFGANGPSEVSQAAVGICDEAGISVVPGYCPHMFLPGSSVIHRLHGWLLKLIKKYPT